MKVVLAADHGGFELKREIINWLQSEGHEVLDVGAHKLDSLDSYADYVRKLVEKVLKEGCVGIFACRSGTAPCMMANRFSDIRAAVCTCSNYAKFARLHQDANVLGLGADYLTFEQVKEVINTFFETPYEGGRHDIRVAAFNKLGEKI